MLDFEGGESGTFGRVISPASPEDLGQVKAAIAQRQAKRQWDLDLHRETCYMMVIGITKGVPSKAKIDFDELGLAPQVIEELEHLGASEPRIPVFEAFNALYNRLDSKRKEIQKLMKCSNRVWFLPESQLIAANQLLDEMTQESEALRQEALGQYEEGLAIWLDGVTHLLTQAGVPPEQQQAAIDRYQERFPRREDVEVALQVSVSWLGEIQPISATIKASLELQAAEAKAKAAEAQAAGELAEADAARKKAALLSMQLKGLESQQQVLDSLESETADEVRQLLADQRQVIMRVVNGDRINNKTHGAVMAACNRLNTLLTLVSQGQRAKLQGEVEKVVGQVQQALNTPRGAFESANLDSEIWATEQALEKFAGDYSSDAAQTHLQKLGDLRARVALLTEVLDSRAQGLTKKLAALDRQIAGSPEPEAGSLLPAYDSTAGF